MFAEAGRRRRAAEREAECLRDITKLTSRASVREAEEFVASAWIELLSAPEGADPVVPGRLARESEAYGHAASERSAESVRDLRRLADLVSQVTEWTQEARHGR